MTGSLTALLHGPWGWRAKWPLYAGAAAAMTAAALVAVVLVPPSGDGPREQLLAEEPTSTPEATASPTPDASAEASPVQQPATASPTPEPVVPRLDEEHFLSTSFVNRAFGQDRSAFVGTWTAGWGAPLACSQVYAENEPVMRVPVARTWAWPDEIVVGETFAITPTTEDAENKLAWCRQHGPGWERDGSVSRPLDIGDEAYVATDHNGLYTQLHAGARIGRVLVLMFWRQSGPIADDEPLAVALRAAVARVRDEPQGAALAAPGQKPNELLRGFLTYTQLRPLRPDAAQPWDGMNWEWDSRFTTTGLSCKGIVVEPGDAPLPTGDMPVMRSWGGGVGNGDDYSEIKLVFATAPDPSRIAEDFAACREVAGSNGYPTATVEDLGDEAFVVDWWDGSSPHIYARSGSTYLVLHTHFVGKDVAPIARAALEQYLAGHPA